MIETRFHYSNFEKWRKVVYWFASVGGYRSGESERLTIYNYHCMLKLGAHSVLRKKYEERKKNHRIHELRNEIAVPTPMMNDIMKKNNRSQSLWKSMNKHFMFQSTFGLLFLYFTFFSFLRFHTMKPIAIAINITWRRLTANVIGFFFV